MLPVAQGRVWYRRWLACQAATCFAVQPTCGITTLQLLPPIFSLQANMIETAQIEHATHDGRSTSPLLLGAHVLQGRLEDYESHISRYVLYKYIGKL